MARLTISINENLYNRISGIAAQSQQSMSSIISQLLMVGIKKLEEPDKEKTSVDAHCQQLTLQMNVLIKKMSEKLLDLTLEDFLELRNASVRPSVYVDLALGQDYKFLYFIGIFLIVKTKIDKILELWYTYITE